MVFETYSKTYEHRLIERIKKWAGDAFIGDDCAVLPGGQLVTSDTLVEGTHFRLPCSLKELGWKSMAVNLSDIAAMAGKPKYAVINITSPESFESRQFDELYIGITDCAKAFRTKIIGGDLTRGSHLVITITVLGEALNCGALLRSTATPGDIVAVTGDFGASAAGLWAIEQQIDGFFYCKERHNKAKTCLKEAWKLAKHADCDTKILRKAPAALMDASDGLADALVQICMSSQVGMKIDIDLVPIAEETAQAAKIAGIEVIDWALYGGEDYELVACIPPEAWTLLGSDNPFKSIGSVVNSQEVSLHKAGKPSQQIDLGKSFQHWKMR